MGPELGKIPDGVPVEGFATWPPSEYTRCVVLLKWSLPNPKTALKVLVCTGPPAATENVSRFEENPSAKSDVASGPHARVVTAGPVVARGVTSSKMLNDWPNGPLFGVPGTTAVVCGAPGATWRSTAVAGPPKEIVGTE